MGLMQSISDGYRSLEDGYYSLLDKVQDRVPVYAIVDPIDRVVPSFALLIVVILGVIAFFLLGGINFGSFGDSVSVIVLAEDRLGTKLPNVPVTAEFNDSSVQLSTNSDGLAVFSVPKNSSVRLKVLLDGFDPIDEMVTVSDRNVAKTIRLLRTETPQERVIQFVDSSNRKISESGIRVKLSCTNQQVSMNPDSFESDSEGQISVTEPVGCGGLNATLLGPGKYATQSFSVNQPLSVIRLDATAVPLGRVRIRIADESDRLISDFSGDVTLMGSMGFERTLPVQNGLVNFQNLSIGTYSASVTNSDHLFADAVSDDFEVTQNHQTEVSINLSRTIRQHLVIRVKNKSTGSGIEGATVTLLKKATGEQMFVQTTDATGEAEFGLLDDFEWLVSGQKENYLPVTMSVSSSQTSATLELEPVSSANSGVVIASVLDEDQKPVENATVRLRYADAETFAPYPAIASDLNGQVKWTGVSDSDELFAYAEKYPASGVSEPFTVSRLEINDVLIPMEIGDTLVTVSALTEDGELIAESTVEFFEDTGSSLGTIPLSNGTGAITFKSDKRIYAIVKNPEFFSYQTETYQLFRDKEIRINAKLPSRLISGGPKAVLVAVESEGGQKVDAMEAGHNYIVRIELKVPEDSAYAQTGIHFRVGNQSRMENDSIVIKAVNAANAAIVRGTTFNPPKGTVVDQNPANLTTGDSKWSNVTWSSPVPQVYSVSFEVRVKNTAVLNAPIPLYYRAWAKTNSNSVLRDPEDAELGSAFSTETRQDLYANAYPVTRYFEGSGSDCDDFFCYSNIRMFDTNQALFLVSPFETAIERDYNFMFEIANSSPANLAGSRFILTFLSDGEEGTDTEILRYRIKNASSQEFTGSSVLNGKIEIDAGNLVPNTGLSGNIQFRPHKIVPAAIRLQTIFQGEIVSTREIPFDVVAERKIVIDLDPKPIPALIDVPGVVSLTEEGNLEPVADAQVTLTRETRDRVRSFQQKNSNGLGNAEFLIPASSPGTRIIVEAAKPDYTADPFETTVDENVLLFDPNELNLSLKTTSQPEAEAVVTVLNQTAVNVRLSKLRLVGRFAGLLDQTKIDGYLGTQVGKTISANSSEEIPILKVFLAPAAALFQNETIKATLAIEAVDDQLNTTWVFSIPVTISIGIDGMPENESCLSIDEPTWETTSQEMNLQHAFTLTNNCQVSGRGLSLSNLQSMIGWDSDVVGNVELTLTDAANPNNSITQVLRDQAWISLFELVPANGTYYGVLTFTPKTGKTGENAVFTVDFAGETPTDAGMKKLTTSQPVSANILITNLRFCLQYTTSTGSISGRANSNDSGSDTGGDSDSNPSSDDTEPTTDNSNVNPSADTGTAAPLRVAKSGAVASLQASSDSIDEWVTELDIGNADDGTITIDSSNCGPLDIDIVLCKDDAECRGGTLDGGILVKPLQFSLSDQNPSREITVSRRDVAGIYGLTVFARTRGRNYNKVATIDVVIDPAGNEFGEYFDLDKYEFFIKGFGTQDSAILTNNNYVTTTTIDAPASSLANRKKAEDDGAFGSMAPLLAAGLIPQMIPALLAPLQGAYDGAKNLGDNKDQALGNAKKASEKAKDETKKLNDDFQKALDTGDIKKIDDALGEKGLQKAIDDGRDLCETVKTDITGCMAQGEDASTCTLNQTILNTTYSNCVNSMSGLENSINNYWDPAKQSFTKAQEQIGAAAQNSDKAFDTINPIGKFDNGSEISASAGRTAGTLQSDVCPGLGKAIGTGDSTGLTGAGSELQKGLDNITKSMEGLRKIKTDQLNKIFSDASGANCSQCRGILDSLKTQLNDKVTSQLDKSLEEMDSARTSLANKFDPTMGKQFQTANTSLGDAKAKCDLAQQAMNDKADATQVVSDHASGVDSGALTNLLSQAAMMGLMSSAMGNAFDEDPTTDAADQRVQQAQQVFTINLPSDFQGLGLDKEGIRGGLAEESVKVYGKTDLTKQSVGVSFENAGLEADEPTYAVADFRATEHYFDAVTKIPFGGELMDMFSLLPDSWGIGQFFGHRQDYSQKFHLKFVSKDTIVDLPPVAGEQFSCTQGAMVGQTSDSALPKIKLKWNWTDITMDSCDARNPDYIYCDSTQFSIMMTQRLHALQEFLEQNEGLTCPTNWLEQQVQAELDPFNQYLAELNFDEFHTSNYATSCWMPKSTDLFEDKAALEFYVEESEDSVNWTQAIPNQQTLHDLLFFDAYLIQDGFGTDFKNDFSNYFSGVALLDTPMYFFNDAQGKNWKNYFESGQLAFGQKFSQIDSLPTSGLYRVETIIRFSDDSWKFFNSDGIPNSSIRIDLLALRQSGLNSVFYYLPFDGGVGLEGSALNRQGYGVGYDILNNRIVTISRTGQVNTFSDSGSNPVQTVSVDTGGSFDSLNSLASQRGFILDILNDSLDHKTMRFTPSLATPVMLKISGQASTEPFGAFYTVRNLDIPQNVGASSTYWSGAGACLDFSGDLVAEAWDYRPDRKALPTDRLPNWENAYGVDWHSNETQADVYLKTVFFTPANGAFSVHAMSDNVVIATPDQTFSQAVNLQGIASMLYNRQGSTESDTISALDDLFNLVSQQKVCVTNTGVRTSFWWNPKTLYEQAGSSGTSVSSIESGLVSGTTCK